MASQYQPSEAMRRGIESSSQAIEQALRGASDQVQAGMRNVILKMCQCGIACNSARSEEDFQNCFQNCQAPVPAYQNAIQQEVGGIQNKYIRCMTPCQDQMQSMLQSGSDTNAMETQAISCMDNCSKTHIALIPAMLARIKDVEARATR